MMPIPLFPFVNNPGSQIWMQPGEFWAHHEHAARNGIDSSRVLQFAQHLDGIVRVFESADPFDKLPKCSGLFPGQYAVGHQVFGKLVGSHVVDTDRVRHRLPFKTVAHVKDRMGRGIG